MKIHYFFRTKLPGYNSIEELFSTITQALENVPYEEFDAPERKITMGSLIRNLKWANKNKGDINHITGDIHYLSFSTGRNTVLTIHDAYSAIQGNLWKRFMIKLWWFWLPALFVKRITTISEKSKKEIERIIPFAKKKIRVIPNPYNPKLLEVKPIQEKNMERYHRMKPVILHLGTKTNKNLERTIRALKDFSCKLYIIGKLSEDQSILLAENNIDFKSYYNLPYEEVALLYHMCDVVCFASTYEGFGMPIIEAQLIGKPVITSDLEPMTWVGGEGACYVNPYSTKSILSGIQKVLGDGDYKDTLIHKGFENVKRFDPVKIASQYMNVYDEIIGDGH